MQRYGCWESNYTIDCVQSKVFVFVVMKQRERKLFSWSGWGQNAEWCCNYTLKKSSDLTVCTMPINQSQCKPVHYNYKFVPGFKKERKITHSCPFPSSVVFHSQFPHLLLSLLCFFFDFNLPFIHISSTLLSLSLFLSPSPMSSFPSSPSLLELQALQNHRLIIQMLTSQLERGSGRRLHTFSSSAHSLQTHPVCKPNVALLLLVYQCIYFYPLSFLPPWHFPRVLINLNTWFNCTFDLLQKGSRECL